jgi:hypothetical protein
MSIAAATVTLAIVSILALLAVSGDESESLYGSARPSTAARGCQLPGR